MRYRLIPLLIVLSGAGVTAGVLWSIYRYPGTTSICAAGSVLCWMLFCVLPWSVLPVGILGGTIAAALLGDADVRTIVVMHALPLVAGATALLTRRALLGRSVKFRRLTPSLGMTVLLIGTIAAATFGLAVGNDPRNVLVAGYQIGVIPVYFFLAAYTLDTPVRLRNAAVLYLVAVTGLTVTEVTAPGRHGGLLTLLAVPPLIFLAGRYTGWRRFGLGLLAAGLSADVVLAAYRGIWLAGAVAIVVLVARGGVRVWRGLVATAGAAVVLVTLFLLSAGIRARSLSIGLSIDRPAGYRVPEATVGLKVFTSRPLFGAGLGQSTLQIYIPGFATTDVGPVYHAFYVVILANLGLVGVVGVLCPILQPVWRGLSERDSLALSFAALTCGFMAAALVSSPTDGHWELGLLPALTLVACQRRVWSDRVVEPVTRYDDAGPEPVEPRIVADAGPALAGAVRR